MTIAPRFAAASGGSSTGFTLIEMLVVVLLIGIIASISIVSYLGSLEDEYLNEAQAQVQAIASAEKMYFLSNSAYPPETSGTPTGDSHQLVNSSALVTGGFFAAQNWTNFKYNYFNAINTDGASPSCIAWATRGSGAMTKYQNWEVCETPTGTVCATNTGCACSCQ